MSDKQLKILSIPIDAILNACHETITNNGGTPHIVLETSYPGVEIPEFLRKEKHLTLNISYSATVGLFIDKDFVSFSARFSGASHRVKIPIAAIIFIVEKETNAAIFFRGVLSNDDSNTLRPLEISSFGIKTSEEKQQETSKVSNLTRVETTEKSNEQPTQLAVERKKPFLTLIKGGKD